MENEIKYTEDGRAYREAPGIDEKGEPKTFRLMLGKDGPNGLRGKDEEAD